MLRALLLAAVLTACSPVPIEPATCDDTGPRCPTADCGVWMPACDGPDFCVDGNPSSVYLGERTTHCDDGIPRCPDGSAAYCVYLPDRAGTPGAGSCARDWCEL